MNLEQKKNLFINKKEELIEFEDEIKKTLFIMEDGFLDSKRFHLYKKKRERELLDFFGSYYRDISGVGLPETIAAIPLYLINCEYEFLSKVGHTTPLFLEYNEEAFMLIYENLKNLTQDIYFDQYVIGMEHYWNLLCINWLKVAIRRENVVEQNYIRFASFDSTETLWFILYLIIKNAMELLGEMLQSETFEQQAQVYEVQKQKYVELIEENTSLEKTAEELKNQNQILQKKIAAFQEGVQSPIDTDSQQENKKLRGQIRKLEIELEKAKERAISLSKENEILLEELKTRNQTNEAEVQEGIDYEGRYLFVGGHYSVIDNLKDLFPNAKFILKETENVSTSTFYQLDGVIYLSKFMNHCMYNNIRKECQRLGIRQFHISKTGTEAILQELKNWKN